MRTPGASDILEILGVAGQIDWSSTIIARMHIRPSKWNLSAPSPVDRGKSDSKIYTIRDRGGLEDVVDGTPTGLPRHRPPHKWPAELPGGKGYALGGCRELVLERNVVLGIARRGVESSKHLGRRRHVIERGPGWTTRFRRLIRRSDREAPQYRVFGTWPALSSASAAPAD